MAEGTPLRILLVVVFITQLIGIFAFDYHHPELWSKEEKECAGRKQSPVDIELKTIKGTLNSKLVISGYGLSPTGVKVTNNGHTVAFSPTYKSSRPRISGGPLNGTYVLDSYHFHWSKTNANGSEHTIDRRHAPLEMHLVHYKESYGSMKAATHKSDGLAVIGILYAFPKKNRQLPPLTPIVDALPKVNKPGKTAQLTPISLSMLGLWHSIFITYDGSLTTPPCSQVVTWLLSAVPHTVTRKQMKAFRQLQLNNSDRENDRPEQAINKRVFRYVMSL